MAAGAAIAAAVVLLGLFFVAVIALGRVGVCVALIVWAGRRIEALDAVQPRLFWPVVPLHYAVALMWWWPALPIGIWMVRQPDLARQGRFTLYWAATPAVVFLASLVLGLASR